LTKHASALIIARPGALREGLRAALAAMPALNSVEEADNTSLALSRFASYEPVLVLLNAVEPDDLILVAYRWIKARWPKARCVVLTDTVRQQRKVRAAGADSVLIKGFVPQKLFAALDRLLPVADERTGPGAATAY
jgi:DNA-binding NarL/FixJ family response regulator